MLVIYLFIITTTLIKQGQSYPTGAPIGACGSMTPKHGSTKPQDPSTSPYIINVDNIHITNQVGDRTVLVTLKGQEFEGFMVIGTKADANVSEDIKPVGEFKEHPQSPGNSTYVACGNNPHSALTHKDPTKKKDLLLQWIPPEQDGDYVILATIAKNKQEYWVKQRSHVIQVRRNGENGFPSIQVHPLGGDAHTPILKSIYQYCGTAKGCFGLPDGCVQTGNCEMLTTFFKDTDSDLIKFQLAGRLPKDSSDVGHVSVGFSTDQKMGKDSVVGCVLQNGRVNVKRYYNLANAKANVILDVQSGFTMESGDYINGFVYCQFSLQPVQIDLKVISQAFNLSQNSLYLLLARASTMGTDSKGAEQLGKHQDVNDKGVSPKSIVVGQYKGDFSTSSTTIDKPQEGKSGCGGLNGHLVKIFMGLLTFALFL